MCRVNEAWNEPDTNSDLQKSVPVKLARLLP